MFTAAELRARARMGLAGKWATAVIAGLIISLLTGEKIGPHLSLHFEAGSLDAAFELFGQTIISTVGEFPDSFELFGQSIRYTATEYPAVFSFLATHAVLILLSVLTAGLVFGVIGSVVSVGYTRFNLSIVDGFEADLNHMIGYFSHWKTAFCAHFLRSLYTFLWTLLFIVPGILAGYNYAMVDYILAEDPELSAGDALALSKQMMYGNRWRYFCLQISFIGWSILCGFTMGIGELWLKPYRQAAYAAFYRSLR